MIDLDISFFIQFGNFVITLIVLNYLLVGPVREVIKKRKDKMAGLVEDSEKFTAEAEQKLENYSKALDEARAEGTSKRVALKDEGSTEEKSILSAAGSEAAATLKAERETVEAEVKTAMDGLKAQIDGLAGKVADKVLG